MCHATLSGFEMSIVAYSVLSAIPISRLLARRRGCGSRDVVKLSFQSLDLVLNIEE